MQTELTTQAKALKINLNNQQYGTIIEIGAGQEVARHFFHVGAAAGTIAKTSSAYDMTVSDAIYGKAGRYVSRERVEKMLDIEYQLCIDRLLKVRSTDTTFFAYAASVEAKSFQRANECHGWIGMQFQSAPGKPCSRVVCHVRMLNITNQLQQEALGILGVNLIYACFYNTHEIPCFIKSLRDNLGNDRIEIDLINFSGDDYQDVNHKLANLMLVDTWLARAILFDPDGQPVVPREVLYKKSVVVTRGSFKPPTKVHQNMTDCGVSILKNNTDEDPNRIVRVAEISKSQLVAGESVNNIDFLERTELANALGYYVLLSDYYRYFTLGAWFRRYTQKSIAILIKAIDLPYIFDEQHYEQLEGGTLEGLGKLFRNDTSIMVYPNLVDGQFTNLANTKTPPQIQHIITQLIENKKLLPIENFNISLVDISARKTLQLIENDASGWERYLDEQVVEIIKQKNFLNYKS